MKLMGLLKKLLRLTVFGIAFLLLFVVLALAGLPLVRSWLPSGHGGRVNSVAFSPDGRTVASGSADSTLMLSLTL